MSVKERFYWIDIFDLHTTSDGHPAWVYPTTWIEGFCMTRDNVKKLYEVMTYSQWFEQTYPIDEHSSDIKEYIAWLEGELMRAKEKLK